MRSAFGEFWFYSPGNSGRLGVHPGTGHVNTDRTEKHDGDPDADIMSWFNRINEYPSLIEPNGSYWIVYGVAGSVLVAVAGIALV
ncbi:hypothetical protein [Gordonia sp. NPDC003950]